MWIKKHQDISHLSLKTDLEQVRAEIATLRAEVKAAVLEMAELSDKAYHMLARTRKRLSDAEPTPEPVEVPEPRLVRDETTERVLARRRHHGISH